MILPIYKRETYPFPPVDPVEGLVLFGSGCASSGGGRHEKKNPKDHSDSLSTSCKRSSRARVQQGLGHKSKFRLLYRRWWPRIGRAFSPGIEISGVTVWSAIEPRLNGASVNLG